MAQYSRATLTDAGVVIARRMMDDDSLHLTFTGIASGDGQYSTGEDLAAKTALKSQKQFFPLSSKKVTSDQVVQLKYVLSNINPDSTPLTVGYYVREVGIFAQVGSEAAVLYAIAVADENTADYLPEYNELQPSTITMDWFLTVANTENISIAASTTAYALAADLAETNAEVATKLTTQGGDASSTIISTVTASAAEYPVPAAGDSMGVITGKIIKFFGDIVKIFTGATSSAAGKKGLVPAPSAGQQTAYMRGDGSWVQPQNNATTTQNGYVLDARMGKTLADGIASLNDSLTWKQLGYSQNINNVYSLPASFTEIYFRVHTRNVASGVYKYAFHLIRSELTSEGNTFYVVGFNNGSKNQCIISASTSQISVNTFVFNNASDLFGESRLWYR